jgi:hypothetical protein
VDLEGQSENCLLHSSLVQSHFYFVLESKGSQRICAAFRLLLLRISYTTRDKKFLYGILHIRSTSRHQNFTDTFCLCTSYQQQDFLIRNSTYSFDTKTSKLYRHLLSLYSLPTTLQILSVFRQFFGHFCIMATTLLSSIIARANKARLHVSTLGRTVFSDLGGLARSAPDTGGLRWAAAAAR